MDPPTPSDTRLFAPPSTASAPAAQFPTPSQLAVNDHVVEPGGPDEIVRGVRYHVSPSLPEHADPHFRLDFVLAAHVGPGYVGATDLLTRAAPNSDFATDVSLRRVGIDPATQRRYLEEVAFEVVNTQTLAAVTAKAQDLTARGVRRVFALFSTRNEVCEWRDGRWTVLAETSQIEDPCLAKPLPVRALLDAACADDAVALALEARANPRLLEIKREAEERGVSHGQLAALRTVAHARGLVFSPEQLRILEACTDASAMEVWISRVGTAQTADDVFR